jgi:flavin reductase (DIM6/NTAB) family NADH-FMN oxidoreductase RutF
MLSPEIKEKIKLDNHLNTVFAPQLVGLVTTLDRASQPNVASLAWIMSTSHYAAFLAVSVSEARYAYECVNYEFVTNLPTKELVEQDRPLEPCWGDT